MKRSSGAPFFFAVLLVAAIYAWSYFGGRGYGGGRGSETFFSPDTLELKSRSELRDPLFGALIYRSSFTPIGRYSLVDYLIHKGYWIPQQPAEPRWIWIYGWSDQHSLGYGPLSRQLSKNREHWKDWTEKNPEFAQILWPRVLEQLRSTTQSGGLNEGFVGLILHEARYAETYEAFRHGVDDLRLDFDKSSVMDDETRQRWQLPASLDE